MAYHLFGTKLLMSQCWLIINWILWQQIPLKHYSKYKFFLQNVCHFFLDLSLLTCLKQYQKIIAFASQVANCACVVWFVLYHWKKCRFDEMYITVCSRNCHFLCHQCQKIHQNWYNRWQNFHQNGKLFILVARFIWHAWSFMPYSSILPYGHNLRKCKHIISRKGFGSVPTPAKFWLAFGSAPRVCLYIIHDQVWNVKGSLRA